MSPSRQDLTTGPIGSTLLKFSLPVLGGNVLQSLNASVNAVWVGHYLGEAALTATSNANIILFFLLGVVFGVGMATTILVGQSVGRKDIAQARCIVGTGSVFFIVLSVIAAVLGYVFTPAIFLAMGTPIEAQPLAISYLRVIFIALPFMFFFSFVMMALRGAGDSRTPFYFMALSVLLDLVLNPVFIFGVGPLPALGIAGSALATLIAQLLSLLAMLVFLVKRGHFLLPTRRELSVFKPKPALLRTLVAKGLPMGLQMVVISSSAIVMISLVNTYGTDTTAAYGVASQLWTYVQMPALALGAGVSSMAAQNVGAGLWNRVDRIATVGVGLNLVLTGALAGVLYVFNRHSLGIFLPEGTQAIAIAQHINLIVVWSFVAFGVTIVVFGVVRATGAVYAPLIILFVSIWLIRLPVASLLQERFGADAIWWSFPLGAMVSLVLAAGYYRFGGWRQSRMTVGAPAPDKTTPVAQAPETGMGMPAAAPAVPRQH
ncbi:MATE family efflux transporter [Pigmentiphaga litoralis]|uniref:MATE family efflux transporter n=1 Tax=Pigmentiphaga litoralis TaxID=516702 RepID=UPI003B429FD2